jgi:CRISPR/Cas system-associated exonuclease Cas4 (RecB family)
MSDSAGDARLALGARFQPAPGILVLSTTRLREFASCRHRYFLSTILQLRSDLTPQDDPTDRWQDGENASRASSIGLWVHEELDQRHRVPAVHHQLDPVQQDRPDDPAAARAIRRHLEVCPGQDGARYLGGELDLRWFHPGKAILLTGRIDALWEHDDGVIEVRDYKTGRPSSSIQDDVGVEMYAFLAAAHHPGRRLRISYEFLGDHQVPEDSDRVVSVEVTPDLLRTAQQRIEWTAGQIRKEQTFPASPSALLCRSCPFRRSCLAHAELQPLP